MGRCDLVFFEGLFISEISVMPLILGVLRYVY